MKGHRHSMLHMILILSFCLVPFSSAQTKRDLKASQSRLIQEVRRELIMLPHYSLFDHLEFRITGVDTVILTGQVTQAILKAEAEDAIRTLERVGKVENNIEVLPVSREDERIRIVAFRAIYGKEGMDKYAIQAVPPIHIIVNNGRITLTGIVASQMDKELAGMAAQGISGVFGVTNNLRVE